MTINDRRPWRGDARAVDGASFEPDPSTSGPADIDPTGGGGRHHEAVELCSDTITLANSLAKLAAEVPALRAALDRLARPPVDRLTYRLDELAAALGVSRRAIERERAAGRFPRPDLSLGRIPLWSRDLVRAWTRREWAPTIKKP
jgi:hypothetical protein